MQNPFSNAAQQLKCRADEIVAKERADQDAVAAEELAAEEAWERAVELFGRMGERIQEFGSLANLALAERDMKIVTETKPIERNNAGSITITLKCFGRSQKSFRVVGNSAFRAFVHELENPKFGPYDLNDVETFPFEDMFVQLLHSSVDVLKKT